ncbi:MAG: DnaJ (Hsp40), subfamily C, member 11 [Marteilia pararefringens]
MRFFFEFQQKSNRDEYLECVQQETAAEGLVIQKALFGPIVMEDGQVNGITECYDVTVASQLLVENHQINIKSRTNLSQLEGFFDPTPGESKNILFRYVYATQQHLAIFKDKEEIFIPQESHLL